MLRNKTLIALDIGEKRTGVALADTAVRIAVPYDTIDVDGTEIATITEIIVREKADVIVIGYPRNQAGLPTAQTSYVESVADKLKDVDVPIVFQDESLTSVIAEDRLKAHKRPYTKADIDAQAAAIILQDYLEITYGR